MELRQLRTFSVVAKRLSFTRAAQELHLAQSSVSAQVQALEEELEVKLFDRLGRRVLLTEAGERLKEYARRMLDMTEEIRGQVAGRGSGGSLRVRVPETLARAFMPEVVERFHAAYPDAALDITNCDDDVLRDELAAGAIDLAFLLVDEPPGPGMAHELLASEELVLAAAPGHELAGRDMVTPQDLHGRTLLLARTD